MLSSFLFSFYIEITPAEFGLNDGFNGVGCSSSLSLQGLKRKIKSTAALYNTLQASVLLDMIA